MKKKLFIITVILSLLFGLSACGSPSGQPTSSPSDTSENTDKDTTKDTSGDTDEDTAKDTSEDTDEPSGSAEKDLPPADTSKNTDEQKYTDILDRYYNALKEQWNQERLMQEGLSTLCSYCYEGNAPENMGYALMDLNGDSQPELLIGAVSDDAYTDKMIFDMYTLVDGTPVQVFSGQERNSYYLCKDESGSFLIENKASMGAAQSAWYYYVMDASGLSIVQGILYDDMANEEAPWFMTYDTDWDTGNDTSITEDMANDIINGYDAQCILPEYTTFLNYQQ